MTTKGGGGGERDVKNSDRFRRTVVLKPFMRILGFRKALNFLITQKTAYVFIVT